MSDSQSGGPQSVLGAHLVNHQPTALASAGRHRQERGSGPAFAYVTRTSQCVGWKTASRSLWKLM